MAQPPNDARSMDDSGVAALHSFGLGERHRSKQALLETSKKAHIYWGFLNSGAEERIPPRGAPLFFGNYGKTQLTETQEKTAQAFCRLEFLPVEMENSRSRLPWKVVGNGRKKTARKDSVQGDPTLTKSARRNSPSKSRLRKSPRL